MYVLAIGALTNLDELSLRVVFAFPNAEEKKKNQPTQPNHKITYIPLSRL